MEPRSGFPYHPDVPAYVLRLERAPYVWLKREAPTVTWGPEHQAWKFKNKGEARLAVARLRKYGPLEMVETDA